MRCDGSEDVAPVECRLCAQPIRRFRKMDRLRCLSQTARRGNENRPLSGPTRMSVGCHSEWPPLRPHPRINNRHVDRGRGKKRYAPARRKQPCDHIVRRNIMAEIQDHRLRRQAQYDTFHNADIGVGQPKISVSVINTRGIRHDTPICAIIAHKDEDSMKSGEWQPNVSPPVMVRFHLVEPELTLVAHM